MSCRCAEIRGRLKAALSRGDVAGAVGTVAAGAREMLRGRVAAAARKAPAVAAGFRRKR